MSAGVVIETERLSKWYGHVLGVCLVLERRLTQILVDVPGALSIGQRGREQPGVSRSTAGNQRPTTPSASPTAGSRRFATTSPDPAHVERGCPPRQSHRRYGRAEHVRKGPRGPTNPGSPFVSSARSRPPVT